MSADASAPLVSADDSAPLVSADVSAPMVSADYLLLWLVLIACTSSEC